jgi:hypothetical protein
MDQVADAAYDAAPAPDYVQSRLADQPSPEAVGGWADANAATFILHRLLGDEDENKEAQKAGGLKRAARHIERSSRTAESIGRDVSGLLGSAKMSFACASFELTNDRTYLDRLHNEFPGEQFDQLCESVMATEDSERLERVVATHAVVQSRTRR